MWSKFVALSAFAALSLGSAVSTAQEFPSRPITYVVPSSPGGGQDTLARIIAARAAEITGTPVIVENQPGAAGNIGANAVVQAEPDGHTLVQLTPAAAINMTLYDDAGYDLLADLRPVSELAVGPFLLIVNSEVPANTFEEFVALAKEKPGELNYGSSGIGGTSHLAYELLKAKAGIDVVHIPYQGSGPAIVDLLAGRIQTMLLQLSVSGAGIEEGTLRPLAISTSTRSKEMPDLPTLAELGLEGYDTSSWYGVLAPADTPDDVVAKLNEIFAQAARDESAAIEERGFEVIASSPEHFGEVLEREVSVWADVVRQSGAKPEE